MNTQLQTLWSINFISYYDHLKLFSKEFPEWYVPERELAIDEQMVGMKSWISIIQFMPKRPKKFGVKFWALFKSSSGYCLNKNIGKGKENNTAEVGLANQIVTDLMKNFVNRNHHLCVYNFSMLPKRFLDMSRDITFCCCTIWLNRGGFPANFIAAKLVCGESIFLKSSVNIGSLLAVHWRNIRDVFTISTAHGIGNTKVIAVVTKNPIQSLH